MTVIMVLHAGGGDQDGQQQPARVNGDMPFRPVHFLAGVVAAAGPGDGLRAAHRLRVDQRGARLRVPGLALLADLFTQVVVHAVQGAVAGPGLEVVVDQFRVREVRG